MPLLKKGYIRDGRFIEETDQMVFVCKVNNYGMKHQDHLPTKVKCPNCTEKLKVYSVDELHVIYICHSCWKKFRRQEFRKDGSKIEH